MSVLDEHKESIRKIVSQLEPQERLVKLLDMAAFAYENDGGCDKMYVCICLALSILEGGKEEC